MTTDEVAVLQDAEKARLALPDGSAVDLALETLQNACNDFRTHMEHRGDDYPFGDQLAELRAVAVLFAADVEEHFKLAQAAALVDKIDMGTAQSPLGPEQRLIYVWPKPADDTDA